MRYYHQYDEKGNHRIGTSKYNKDKTKPIVIRWGQWASYRSPAMLGQYAAVTEYYAGSKEFPQANKLYRITKDVWPLEDYPTEVTR